MQRRLPKRGFAPLTKRVFSLVKVGQLDIFESGSTITIDDLVTARLVESNVRLVKILADGDLSKSLNISAHKFSSAARDKILANGGTCQEI